MSNASKKRIVKPPLDRFGGVRVVQRRVQKLRSLNITRKGTEELVDIAKQIF